MLVPQAFLFFFFNDTATTEIYTLSLHDALPISDLPVDRPGVLGHRLPRRAPGHPENRSEEHTSELQSPCNLVCRLLLEKKKKLNLHSTPQTSLVIFLQPSERRARSPPDAVHTQF